MLNLHVGSIKMVNKYLDLVDFSRKYILYIPYRNPMGFGISCLRKKHAMFVDKKNPALSDRSRYVRIL